MGMWNYVVEGFCTQKLTVVGRQINAQRVRKNVSLVHKVNSIDFSDGYMWCEIVLENSNLLSIDKERFLFLSGPLSSPFSLSAQCYNFCWARRSCVADAAVCEHKLWTAQQQGHCSGKRRCFQSHQQSGSVTLLQSYALTWGLCFQCTVLWAAGEKHTVLCETLCVTPCLIMFPWPLCPQNVKTFCLAFYLLFPVNLFFISVYFQNNKRRLTSMQYHIPFPK